MSDAKRLLDEATPLPWMHVRIRDDHDELAGAVFADHPDGALLLHAVNRLPDYLAAVEALQRLMTAIDCEAISFEDDSMRQSLITIRDARAVLARLRDEVPA